MIWRKQVFITTAKCHYTIIPILHTWYKESLVMTRHLVRVLVCITTIHDIWRINDIVVIAYIRGRCVTVIFHICPTSHPWTSPTILNMGKISIYHGCQLLSSTNHTSRAVLSDYICWLSRLPLLGEGPTISIGISIDKNWQCLNE